MTAGADTSTGVGRHRGGFIAAHARRLEQIPEPPETFLQRELPSEARDIFARLRENDFVHRVEYDQDEEVYRWRLDTRVAAALDQITTTPQPGTRVTPCCGYRGFSNLRDGGFECGFCGEEFDDFHVVGEVADDE